jgi:hypothetical protein
MAKINQRLPGAPARGWLLRLPTSRRCPSPFVEALENQATQRQEGSTPFVSIRI